MNSDQVLTRRMAATITYRTMPTRKTRRFMAMSVPRTVADTKLVITGLKKTVYMIRVTAMEIHLPLRKGAKRMLKRIIKYG